MFKPTRVANEYMVRRFEPGDAESLFDAVRESVEELSHWMTWCTVAYSLQDAEKWIRFTVDAWASGSEYPLGIFHSPTGSVVGGTGVSRLDRANRTGNIGYWVSSRHTGRGVARFAALHSARLGFGQLGLTRLEIVVLTHNKASQRVAQSLRATLECEARNRLYFRGAPHNAYVYSLIPSDLSSDA